MAKVLVFTVIEKLGYKSDVMKGEKLAPWIKDEIKQEYGIKKRSLNHESIYGSEAPNGDELYIEVVAADENWREFSKVVESIRKAKIRKRYELDEWVKNSGYKLVETDASIGMYDEYLLEI